MNWLPFPINDDLIGGRAMPRALARHSRYPARNGQLAKTRLQGAGARRQN